ncbi:serine/threonine-protein kinase [Streptantibioticus silvisoli]|uniref:non-specific serine/threonine protein kinase n=1 Tax=Streptantibioticus silvisoli TaxID=2705255 RepID=A0ABT6VS85_9ACTN|nr:serine/threonine-protein kinase [Streptantibioticus silvisoli]MDI5961329.1 serine/threonine-protein kinase [Streptantibioticus silvisoli]
MLIKDRYRLEEVLGRGGMGEVWRGTDELLGRRVAVKLMTGTAGDERAIRRFADEARIAGSLSHPNTVAVYDFGTINDQPFMVMEYVDGHTLETEVAALRRLAPEDVSRIGGQTAAGLAAAHRAGIVHRDIKPANLMLTSGGVLKISDFGIAQFVNDSGSGLTGTGMVIGSATYMAPERALGRTADHAADLYALGCVLHELLTGRPPFTGANAAAVLAQHVESPPPDPRQHRADIPGPLAGLVTGLLAKEPHLRPTAADVTHWLAPVALPGGTTGTPAAPAGPPPAARAEPGRMPPAAHPDAGPAAPGAFGPPTLHALPEQLRRPRKREVAAAGVLAAVAAAVRVASTLSTTLTSNTVPDRPPNAQPVPTTPAARARQPGAMPAPRTDAPPLPPYPAPGATGPRSHRAGNTQGNPKGTHHR